MDDRVQHAVDQEDDDYDPFEDSGALTQKQANEYLMGGGSECPYCHSDNIQSVGRDMVGGAYFLDMTCDDCQHSWSEGYALIEIYDEEGTQFRYQEEDIPI